MLLLWGGGAHSSDFEKVISLANLLGAWKKFSKGKHSSPEVAVFELNLESNLFTLHETLAAERWTNDPYRLKHITDPKPRRIHVASVRDRVLFQVMYRYLYDAFDATFIHDSYASREHKGTHAGVDRFGVFAHKVSANYTRPAFALKCDIRKFFDSIDHATLFSLIARKVKDPQLLSLISRIIASFETTSRKGLPLGNVTSQIFANIYLNELDQFVKHELKAQHYLRYCDDFVILDRSSTTLVTHIPRIHAFLAEKLLLELHPRKVTIRKLRQGIDFLGYVSLPHYRVLRTRTKHRMLKRVNERNLAAYGGLLAHCNGEKMWRQVESVLSKRAG